MGGPGTWLRCAHPGAGERGATGGLPTLDVQLCGDALGARFDVMAEARALVPQLLADAAIIAPLPDWRDGEDGEEGEEDDDDDEEEEEG